MSKRFIVQDSNISLNGDKIIVVGEEVHHINVLRYKLQEFVNINEYSICIQELTDTKLVGRIESRLEKIGEPQYNITLLQAYLKSDKMDYVVQKAVELGAKEIVPIITKNVIVKLDEKDKLKKTERLNKIAKEAVEQCGRTDMVKVGNVENINLVDYSLFDAVVICHEQSNNSLKGTLESIKKSENLKNIAVIIGPEGGLSNDEVESILKLNNTYEVSLGKRILRAETASLSILSILWYELEN